MNFTSQRLLIPIFAISLIGLLIVSVSEYVYLTDKVKEAQAGIHLSGTIKIYQGDKLVRNIPDAIQNTGGEDTILCEIFNNTTECNNATNYYGSDTNQIGTTCQYWKGSVPTITKSFYSNSMCNPTAIAVSTDSSTVTTNTGCPVLTASSLSPVHATQVQQPVSTSQNSIILTGSFSPTGTQTINKLCLIMWNSHSSTYSAANDITLGNGATAVNAWAIDAVSPAYTTTNGIPFTVQWTITLTYS